jgi:hypothetical protein
MQPLLHFINSADFTTQLSTVLCNFNKLIFYNFIKRNIKLPEDGAEAPKHIRALVTLYILIYM